MGVDKFASTTVTKLRIGGTAGVEATENLEVVANAVIGGTLTVGGANGIVGSTGATDNRLLRADGTGTKTVQNSAVACDDSGNLTGVGTLNTRTIANWVDGPAATTDNAIARFDATTGKLLQNSAGILDDSGNLSGIGTVGCGAITTTGDFIASGNSRSVTAGAGTSTGFVYIRAKAAGTVYAGLALHSADAARWTIRRAPTTDNLTIDRFTGSAGSESLASTPISIANSDGVITVANTMLYTGIRAVTATGSASAPEIAHGTYTPTLTGISNVDSTTAYPCIVDRTGNTVKIEGRFLVDATSTTTNTVVDISLPVASNFTGVDQATGRGACGNVAVTLPPGIYANTTDDRLRCEFVSGSTGSHEIRFTASFTVV